jgi:CO/xanthine dehydrogenase Mo-binding subunit
MLSSRRGASASLNVNDLFHGSFTTGNGTVERLTPVNCPVLGCRLLPGLIEQSRPWWPQSRHMHTPVISARPSRRQVLHAGALAGIAVYIAPFGTRAFASLFEDQLLTRPAWNDGVLKYRVDGTSQVTGEKVFARDIRARDMPHWPQQQAHALALRVTKADRRYAGFDLSLLGSDLTPDHVVTAADLERDGLDFPSFYGNDMLLPEGETPAYLGQAVALLIYKDFARFRFAKDKLQFNDAVIRYGEVTGPLQRNPWGSARCVRIGSKTPDGEDVYSALQDGPISPSFAAHEPIWPKPARDGDAAARGIYHADRIGDELAKPPADWLVLTREYATQSGDVAAMEPDCANGWYDRDRQELHLVVPTQSPQEVAEGVAAMLGKSRIGLKRLFLHPCFTVGYGSKDHCPMPYYGVLAAVYGAGRPVRLANDRFEQFQAGLKRHKFNVAYTAAVDRHTGLLQSFRANIVANGGGRANCSFDLTLVGAVSVQSVYYLPKFGVIATAISSRAIDCGAARGFGALETMTATELMVDEIASELGLDPIEFRLRNVWKTGMRSALGAVPHGTQRAEEILQRARAHALWADRAARKRAYEAAHPGKHYGVGFGCIQRRFGEGAEAAFAKVELAPDGRITLSHSGTKIGTGTSSGQTVACARWLGRPADKLDLAVTEWPDLPLETSGDPFEPGRAGSVGEEPALEPGLCVGFNGQQLVLLFYACDAGGGADRLSPWAVASRHGDLGRQWTSARNARGGALARRALGAAAAGAARAGGACTRPRGRRSGACLQSLAMGGSRLRGGRRHDACAARCPVASLRGWWGHGEAACDHTQPLFRAGAPVGVVSVDAERQSDARLQHRGRHPG